MDDPQQMSPHAHKAAHEALEKYTLKKTSAGIKLVPKAKVNVQANMAKRQAQAQAKSMKSIKIKQFGAI